MLSGMSSTTTTRRLLGPAVKVMREQLGIRHGVFAVEVGISPGYLSNIEAGKKQPAPHIVKAIADKLGVTLDAVTYVTESKDVA